jgi:preprotein translocase subunit SecF
MLELIPHNTKFDFMGKAKLAMTVSLLCVIGSLYLWFSKGDTKYGVDYKGGHEYLVKITTDANSETIRNALTKGGIEDALVQSFELGSQEYSIRTGGLNVTETDAKIVRAKVEDSLKSAFADKFEILKADFVGPTVGNELRRQAIWAVVFGALGILIYVTIRFEFAFALGAVVALVHDVIISAGVYLLVGKLISVDALAAALTILGYSVNDTIVVFDRVREELLKDKNADLVKTINYCVNLTLSRTVITHMLTFVSALTLYLFGGGEIEDLSLFLMVGIVSGTYSTVFIASPIALWWEGFRAKLERRKMSKATA